MKNIVTKLLLFLFISLQFESCTNLTSASIQYGCDSVSKSNPVDTANRNLSPFTDSNGKNINITVEFRPISEDFKPVPEIGYVTADGDLIDRSKALYGLFENIKDGKILSQKKFKEIKDFNWGLAAFQDRNLLWGFISGDGTVAIPAKFKDVSDFKKGIATFSGMKDYPNKDGFIDRFGNIIIDLESQNLSVYQSEVDPEFSYKCGLYPVCQIQTNIFYSNIDKWTRLRWAYINKEGKLVSPFYDERIYLDEYSNPQ